MSSAVRLLCLAGLLSASSGCRKIVRAVVKNAGDSDLYVTASGPMSPTFSGRDLDRTRIDIQLLPVAEGFAQPVDLVFEPGSNTQAVVVERAGRVVSVDLQSGAQQTWWTIEVATEAEQGLLGFAYHPRFPDDPRVYTNAVRREDDDVTVVEEWTVAGSSPGTVTRTRTLLRVVQPYQNHNGGDLEFGPDGLLYVGLGDGGAKDDLDRHAQNGQTLLGSMVRLDVNAEALVPPGNPFVSNPEVRDEAYAVGLRNPWRTTFAPSGQLVVADVGQDAWEEVSLVSAGDNLGWPIREADHCFKPKKGCQTDGLVDPIFSYDHTEGQSITGGVVVTGDRAPSLQGQYLFGDFVSGRLWALELPDTPERVEAATLGQWPFLVASFAVDAAGDGYVLDFGRGAIYAITSPEDPALAAAGSVASAGTAACIACHGARGEGSVATKAPAIGGQSAAYLARQLAHYRDGVRAAPQMQSVLRGLDDAAVAALAEDVAAWPRPAPEATVTGGDATRGAVLYAGCAVCHGTDGAGMEAVGAPALVGQHDWYLVEQLQAWRAGTRGTADDPLAVQMRAGAAVLADDAAVLDVVAHIQALGQPAIQAPLAPAQ